MPALLSSTYRHSAGTSTPARPNSVYVQVPGDCEKTRVPLSVFMCALSSTCEKLRALICLHVRGFEHKGRDSRVQALPKHAGNSHFSNNAIKTHTVQSAG